MMQRWFRQKDQDLAFAGGGQYRKRDDDQRIRAVATQLSIAVRCHC